MNIILVLFLYSFISFGNAQRVIYLNGLQENQYCEYEQGVQGICKIALNCRSEFENFKKHKKTLKICSYGRTNADSIICCPNETVKTSKVDLANFETCREEFLKFRKNGINIFHYVNAYSQKKIPNTLDNCKKIDILHNKTYRKCPSKA